MKVIDSSIKNLADSHDELSFAVNHLRDDLLRWREKLEKSLHLTKEEHRLVESQYHSLDKEISITERSLKEFRRSLELIDNEDLLEQAITEKNFFYSKLRIYFSQYAALVTCLNWQSPSIKPTTGTRVGIEKESIKADWNDYKRDRSGDTFHCEAFLRENVLRSQSQTNDVALNVFNSGMGAFTTLLYFLICEKVVERKILASSHIYVENMMLLKSFFGANLETIDYNDTQKIVNKIISDTPDVVFLEPLSNTKYLRLFDIADIIKNLSEKYNRDIYFMIDVTCSVGFENLLDDINLPKNIKVALHGSLLKSPQLGIERVNMGFVQTFGFAEKTEKILDYRSLSGTNIQDFTANLLPFTNREFIQKRMRVIETNVVTLAIAMSEVDPQNLLVAEVVYPGLVDHEDYDLSSKTGFTGLFFNIILKERFNHDKYFEIFTSEVIKKAQKYGCDIVHGASFGFNHTSIYYSVGWDEPNNHYIRISAGTETMYEVEKLKKVLIEAFRATKELLETSNEL